MTLNKNINTSEQFHFKINEYSIKGILSFSEFEKYYTSKKTWLFNWKYVWVKDKLNNLSELLEIKYSQKIDPIEYLLYLYYWKKISIIDISDKLKSIWINYPKSTLHNLFSKTLDLELRDRLEETNSRKEKEHNHWLQNSFNTRRSQETLDAVQSILENNKWINIGFNLKKFNKLKNKTQKLIFLLYNFSFIKDNNENWVKQFIEKLYNWWLWTHRITNLLKEIINTYIIQNNKLKIKYINLDSKLIWEILNKKNS